ncbi:MAG: peroxiredoxin family protein [Planctomycetaceae bacterium]
MPVEHPRRFPVAVMPAFFLGLAISVGVAAEPDEPKRPAVGDAAADFELATVDGKEKIKLTEQLKKGPVVLLVLRGFPGYQCPLCTAQIGKFLNRSKAFAKANATVVMIYPGPADGLKSHAEDFVRGKTLPDNFLLLLDPDYKFTNSYHLRWDAKNETAYPSTFVIGQDGKIRFAKISMKHGGRSSPDEVLKAIPAN